MNKIRRPFCLFFLGLLLASAFSVASAGTLHQQSTGGSDCFISTTSARTVSVRVGPGENRTPVAFLQVDKQFEVLGRYVAADESVWYQIDPRLAAPKKAIKEAWVAAGAKVDESGDCEAVPDADAPPIIPITVRPTAAPAGSSLPQPEPVEASAGSTTLLSGNYTISYAPQFNASCEGTGNVVLNSSEALNQLVFVEYVQVTKTTVQIDGDQTTLQPNGTFVGQITLGEVTGTIVVRPVSATVFAGDLIASFRLNGRNCSASIGYTASRR